MMAMEHLGTRMIPLIENLLGCEAKIELRDGELLEGTPMELSFARHGTPQLAFEECHGDYRWLDLDDIQTVRRAA
ncbi:MAG: hypothetical protein ACJ8C4_05015 [Gemmataceae bacterium]